MDIAWSVLFVVVEPALPAVRRRRGAVAIVCGEVFTY